MSCCFSAVGFRLVHLLYVGNCFAVSRALSIVIVQVLSLSLSAFALLVRRPCSHATAVVMLGLCCSIGLFILFSLSLLSLSSCFLII
jgi:hypothetical protein